MSDSPRVGANVTPSHQSTSAPSNDVAKGDAPQSGHNQARVSSYTEGTAHQIATKINDDFISLFTREGKHSSKLDILKRVDALESAVKADTSIGAKAHEALEEVLGTQCQLTHKDLEQLSVHDLADRVRSLAYATSKEDLASREAQVKKGEIPEFPHVKEEVTAAVDQIQNAKTPQEVLRATQKLVQGKTSEELAEAHAILKAAGREDSSKAAAASVMQLAVFKQALQVSENLKSMVSMLQQAAFDPSSQAPQGLSQAVEGVMQPLSQITEPVIQMPDPMNTEGVQKMMGEVLKELKSNPKFQAAQASLLALEKAMQPQMDQLQETTQAIETSTTPPIQAATTQLTQTLQEDISKLMIEQLCLHVAGNISQSNQAEVREIAQTAVGSVQDAVVIAGKGGDVQAVKKALVPIIEKARAATNPEVKEAAWSLAGWCVRVSLFALVLATPVMAGVGGIGAGMAVGLGAAALALLLAGVSLTLPLILASPLLLATIIVALCGGALIGGGVGAGAGIGISYLLALFADWVAPLVSETSDYRGRYFMPLDPSDPRLRRHEF